MTQTDTPAVRIVAKRNGFARCGKIHPDTAVTHPAGTFTEDEIKRLQDERMLVVDVLDGTEGDAAPEKLAAAAAISADSATALGVFLRELGVAGIEASNPHAIDPELVEALDECLAKLPGRTKQPEGGSDGPAETKPLPGEGGAAPSREERIRAAITEILDEGEEGDLTKGGVPTIQAIERITGLNDVTAAERDAARNDG